MARPPNTDSAVTRAKILESALELFAERGFFGTSMRQIGAASGVTGSALYHHFDSKEAILHAVIGELFTLGQGQLMRLMEGGDLGNIPSLEVLFRKLCTQAFTIFELPMHRKLFRVMMNDGTRLQQEGLDLNALVAGPREFVRGLLRGLMAAGKLRSLDVDHALMLIVGPLLVYRQAFMIWGAPAAEKKRREAFIRDYSESLARAFKP